MPQRHHDRLEDAGSDRDRLNSEQYERGPFQNGLTADLRSRRLRMNVSGCWVGNIRHLSNPFTPSTGPGDDGSLSAAT